jgi:antitoxin VapB
MVYPSLLPSKIVYAEYIMERSSIFKSNKSQAVRLPKPVSLPDSVKQVDIISLGRARLIVPAGEAWDSWFEGEGVTDDFMSERDQPSDQERELL